MAGRAMSRRTFASTTIRSRSRSWSASTACTTSSSGRHRDEKWLEVDIALADELRERLGALGYDGELPDALAAWAGTENLEERISGADRIDPVVLEQLRAR